jgi:hypothetical protein
MKIRGVLAYSTYAAEGGVGVVGSTAALGAFIDWRIFTRRTVYRAP